jgi:hypothetical protein
MKVTETRLPLAAEYVQAGWIKHQLIGMIRGGRYYSPPVITAVCALGAIRLANGATVHGLSYGEPKLGPIHTQREERIMKADRRALRWYLLKRGYPCISWFNDRKLRTKSEVVAALQACGEKRQRKLDRRNKRAKARANLRG